MTPAPPRRSHVDLVVNEFVQEFGASEALVALIDCLFDDNLMQMMVDVMHLTQREEYSEFEFMQNPEFLRDLVRGFLTEAQRNSSLHGPTHGHGLNAPGVIQTIDEMTAEFLLIIPMFDELSADVLSRHTECGQPLDYELRLLLLGSIIAATEADDQLRINREPSVTSEEEEAEEPEED
jgi:hypothetical protein